MNLRSFVRTWRWVAVVCCAVSVLLVGASYYMGNMMQCSAVFIKMVRSGDYAAARFEPIFISCFLVFFFFKLNSDRYFNQAEEIFNSEAGMSLISAHLPITAAHLLVYGMLSVPCILTFMAPALGSALVREFAINCKFP